MPVVSPYEVQQVYEMLENLRELEARGKVPAGTTESQMSALEGKYERGGDYGSSANQGFTGFIGNPEPTRAPWRGEYDMPGNFERGQHMANSMANDAMLRELLGYSRKRTEADDVEGTFALARYPGLEFAISVAESGQMPAGMMPDFRPERAAERQEWGRKQRELAGMDRRIGAREARGFNRGTRGMGAREKRAAFRRFLRG